jgi:hypothetical protein
MSKNFAWLRHLFCFNFYDTCLKILDGFVIYFGCNFLWHVSKTFDVTLLSWPPAATSQLRRTCKLVNYQTSWFEIWTDLSVHLTVFMYTFLFSLSFPLSVTDLCTYVDCWIQEPALYCTSYLSFVTDSSGGSFYCNTNFRFIVSSLQLRCFFCILMWRSLGVGGGSCVYGLYVLRVKKRL